MLGSNIERRLLLLFLGSDDSSDYSNNDNAAGNASPQSPIYRRATLGERTGNFNVVSPVKFNLGVGFVVGVYFDSIGVLANRGGYRDDSVDAVIVVAPSFQIAIALAILGESFRIVVQGVEEVVDDDFKLSIRHFSYSGYFEEEFQKQTGKSLMDNMLALFYNHDINRKEIVDGYWRTMRLICTRNEDAMYAITKEELSPDAFWGIHPTWWGNKNKQYFEFFKNGFYWWDAKRDIAQTDEMVSFPIRTALAHRFESPRWYNMWYSMGTRNIRGYFPETWTNLRFGGRTHYLGYECPNESVVLEFKPRGLLEAIESLDRRVRLFDSLDSQPDCRVLLFFGFEAVSNYVDFEREMPWAPESPRLMKTLDTCNELFPMMLCDLVPSYAVENGSLFVNENGKAQYGNQEYDVVIALYPRRLTAEAKAFLGAVDPKKLVLCDGEEVDDLAQKGAVVIDFVPPADNLYFIAKELGAAENRTENGCVNQDGSLIFTSTGTEPIGNKLDVEMILSGKHIVFHGEDAVWISADGKRAIYPKGQLWVNGIEISSER